MSVKTILCDDDVMALAAMESYLDDSLLVDVIATCSSIQDAIREACTGKADVLVVSPNDFRRDGVDLARRLASKCPAIRVLLICSGRHDSIGPDLLGETFGILQKSVTPRGLEKAIVAVSAGLVVFSETAVQHFRPGSTVTDSTDLTDEQREILDLVAKGKTNTQIASMLHISESTVKRRLASLMSKLGSPNRVAVVLQAQRQGLVRVNEAS